MKKKIDLAQKIFFIPRSLKTSRKNRTSPNNGPIKIFFCKILIFWHNLKRNITNFKMEAKKNLYFVYFKQVKRFFKAWPEKIYKSLV
jgi:hypothetical protein